MDERKKKLLFVSYNKVKNFINFKNFKIVVLYTFTAIRLRLLRIKPQFFFDDTVI